MLLFCCTVQEQARRLNELKEKKQKDYEALSYEQQQKLDALNQKKMQRKRGGRKVGVAFTQPFFDNWCACD